MEDKFDVLDFLINNPYFLVEHANKLGINFDSIKLRSLSEAQILANKNKLDEISTKYQAILQNIKDNEIILNKLDKLYFNLMECKKLFELINIIANSLKEDFSLPIFAIKFINNNNEKVVSADNILDINSQDYDYLKKLDKPFGDNKCIIDSLYRWLPKKAQVESFLHIPLNYKDQFLGFILIGHEDYKYFAKDVATDFIDSMSKAISITLYRILY